MNEPSNSTGEAGRKPSTAHDWDARYEGDDVPWEIGRVDANLRRVVLEQQWQPRRVLEIGCGMGSDACWLAGQGFDVTALDWAPRAIAAARARADALGVTVAFREGSFPDPAERFDLAYDRGCFHTVAESARAGFVDDVAQRLAPDGCWLSICGSTDGPPRDHGPPRMSAHALVGVLEPRFEILSLRDSLFDADLPSPARTWVMLARVR